jgi:hypothetical protein
MKSSITYLTFTAAITEIPTTATGYWPPTQQTGHRAVIGRSATVGKMLKPVALCQDPNRTRLLGSDDDQTGS